MNIIVIESSGLVASVALVTEDRVIAEYTVNNKKTHSQTLLPMLDEIVKASELDMSEVDAIAISRGPGSFTGLRIGSATAKGLGLALDKPLIEVSTLEILAANFFGTGDSVICPVMDARRQEVYTAVYECDDEGVMHEVFPESAIPLTEIMDELNRLGRRVIFTGDAVPVYESLIREGMKVPFSFAPIHMSRQRAAAAGSIAVRKLSAGDTVPAAEHAPTYLRLSQAEREKNSAGI